MEKKTNKKFTLTWWSELDTFVDDHKISISLFKKYSPGVSLDNYKSSLDTLYTKSEKSEKLEKYLTNAINNSKKLEIVDPPVKTKKKCKIIKAAFHKFYHYLRTSHKAGCPDKSCHYSHKIFKIKVCLKNIKKDEDEWKKPTINNNEN